MASEEQGAEETTSLQSGQQTVVATQCHHPLHPAYAPNYSHTQCPLCRMTLRSFELECIDHFIDAKGGVGQWHQDVLDCLMSKTACWEERVSWLKSVWGGSISQNEHVEYDTDGKDISHRHAKMRLHNLVTEVEELAEKEAKWNGGKPIADELLTRQECLNLAFSATKVLQYYNDQRTAITRLEEKNAQFSRQRGREWEISTDPNYPQAISEPKDANQSYFTTLEQREFIKASNVPPTSVDKYIAMPTKKSSRTRTGVNVSFSSKVHVRTENDIDILRDQGMLSSEKTYDEYALDFEAGFLRKVGLSQSHRYQNAVWGLKQSKRVDTSGRRWKQHWVAWEEYVQAREEYWQDMEDKTQPPTDRWINTLKGKVVVSVVVILVAFLAVLLAPQE